MAQQQITGENGALGGSGSLTIYTVPGSATVVPNSASVTFDGSGASGSFLPCITFKTQTGAIIARCPAPGVAQGDTTEVSWFPSVGGGDGIRFDTYPQQGDWLYVETGGSGGPNNDGQEYVTTDTAGTPITDVELGGGGAPGAGFGFFDVDVYGTDNSGIDLTTHDTHNAGINIRARDTNNAGVNIEASEANNAGVTIEAQGANNAGVSLEASSANNAGVTITSRGSGGAGLQFTLADGTQWSIAGLPTVNPGGTGRIWSNAGVLSIT